ncbi:MAG TPA: zinc-binding alcohol dehydrogenase family protein [Polyangia bacterium]|nr:zinc-binding alcohol dehydrogenase family protein [Polyangia bacterium]
MKAAVVRAFDQAPHYEAFSPPADAEGTLVDVLAAALSPRVRSAASGRHYTSRGILPLVPGLDGVGRLADGRRVYFVAADDRLGTMADQTRAHPRLMVDLPESLPAPTVAAAMLPAISSWVALSKRSVLQRGQSVLVLGATGTSGQLAVQIARHLGAGRVVAAGRNAEALDRLRDLGASEVVRLGGTQADAGAVAAAASEVDIVLDYLWGQVTTAVMPALCRRRQDESRALDWVLIGSVAGDEIALSSVLLRKRNLRVLGSGQGAVSTAEMFSVSADVMAAGELRVRVREAPLADVERLWTAASASGERLVFVP